MPVAGIGLAVERDVVDPHVEVRPVDAGQENYTAQCRTGTGLWKNEPHTDGDFHDTRDEHPNRGVAQDCRNDGFEPSGVGEVLNADVDVHASKHDGGDGEGPASHNCSLRQEQVNLCFAIGRAGRKALNLTIQRGRTEWLRCERKRPESFNLSSVRGPTLKLV